MATPDIAPLAGRSSRSEQVYDALRDALLSGSFTPGDQLREGEIAQQLGVSKTPVREAFSTLRAKGLLKSSPTRGMLVTEIDRDTLKQLYEVRGLLEPEAIRLAVPKTNDKVLVQARRLLAESQRHGQRRDFNALSRSNRDFHELLYEPCENTQIKLILDDMRDQLQFAAASGWRGPTPSWEQERCEHLAILDAIANGDAERAAELSKHHIDRAAIKLLGSDDH